MKYQSPSLPELHAFLAVFQLGSFRSAASVLFVTQAAVSRAVQRLEQRLGCSLFDRTATGVVPTQRGREFQSLVQGPVAALENSIMRFGSQPAGSRKLRLSVVPTLGTRWLMPRLADFQTKHPDITIELRQFHHDESFDRDDVDIWIDVKRPNRSWPRGLRTHYLLGKEITPICAPTIAKRLQQPADLLKESLLHHTNFPDNWALWLHGAGLALAKPALGPGFDLGNNLIVAACSGMGAIVIQPCLIEAELATGQLVQPFAKSVSTGRGYSVCYKVASAQNPMVVAFVHWLDVQAQNRLHQTHLNHSL
jgi:LysR family transcriptional regulator, glycine cleavage system transcriptional activator